MDADTLLERLRDEDPDGPLARLADLAADEFLATPVGELLDPAVAAAACTRLVEAHLAAPDAHAAIERRLEAALDALGDRDAVLADLLPEELPGLLAELAEREVAPDEALIVAWLDRDPVRRLLRKLLQEALVAFGNRLRAPVDNRITRGLGDLGRFARDAALGRAGTLGAFATEMVGVAANEVERQLEKRAAEFADGAIAGVIHRIANLLADRELADEQAALRLALLEGLFELSAAQLAAEGRKLDFAGAAAVVRRWLERWLAREDAEAELAQAIADLLGADAARPLGEVLAELGVEEAARAIVADGFEARLRPFVAGEGFATWVRALVGRES